MYFFLKYIVTLFYKKLRIKIVVCLRRESGPRSPIIACNMFYMKLFVNLAHKSVYLQTCDYEFKFLEHVWVLII